MPVIPDGPQDIDGVTMTPRFVTFCTLRSV